MSRPDDCTIAFVRGYITGRDAAQPFRAYPDNPKSQAAYDNGHQAGLADHHANIKFWAEFRQARAAENVA